MENDNMATGGITKGKSHAEGGMPMVVKSTGQKVELEGGEGVINKKNMADTKLHDYEGNKLTKCEIASEINSDSGNGVKIDCDDVKGKKYKHEDGGKVNQIEYGGGGNVFPDLTKNQRNQIMEVYLGNYNHGGNICGVMDSHNQLKSRKYQMKKMRRGGSINEKNPMPTSVDFILNKSKTFDVFSNEDYNYVNSINLKADTLYNFMFEHYDMDSNDVRFYLNSNNNNKGHFFNIDKGSFHIKNINGGEVKDFTKSKLKLSFEDMERLELIRAKRPNTLTADQISFLSDFKGGNAVNEISTETIKYLYSLMFEHKSTSVRIGKIAIMNNGVGNLVALAPKYAHVSVCYENYLYRFALADIDLINIESQINTIQNYSSDFQNWSYFEDISTLNADAIIGVYPEVNPNGSFMIELLYKNAKSKTIGVALSEFTSDLERTKFKNMETNSRYMNDMEIIHQKIEQGITEKGDCSLITIFKFKY